MSSTSRLKISDELMAGVSRRLTKRDHLICHLAFEHRVLTSNQIADAFFDTAALSRLRLVNLYRMSLLDRFRTFQATGSSPYHYVIGLTGVHVIASQRGVEATELGYRPEQLLAWAASPRLDHLVGLNSIFMALLGAARRSGGRASLDEWWSERRCHKAMAGFVIPDGYGIWREGNAFTEFCLEYDMGTETLDRLKAKLTGYRDLERASGVCRWVLFCLQGTRREAEVRRALGDSPVPVATAYAVTDPAGPVWLPVDSDGPRQRLSELATVPWKASSV